MNALTRPQKTSKAKVEIRPSTCPHDCPSTCALEVERIDARTIGRVRGAAENGYTLGTICAKVARYAERVHHPDRLMHPLVRVGAKGSGRFERIGWDAALDLVAEKFLAAEARHGSEAVWPYYYAGTMGLVNRDGINRLRHAKKYSGFHSTICVSLADAGYIAGTGRKAGVDPREMAHSDLIVLWGTNAVATQVNVMTHATQARKARGAKIVVVDPYRNPTAKQADIHLMPRPSTDGALACGIMHVLFRDGLADWDYLRRYTDAPEELAQHLKSRTPQWAEAICGVPAAEIEAFARLYGSTKRSYIRLGYGFSRARNGAAQMHAALCLPAVTGAWSVQGGGALYNNGAIYHWDKTLIEGLDARDPAIRMLDQSRIGPVLTGDRRDLGSGPPVTAMLIQSTNPASVAPELDKVRAGFLREDLFVCVHEQFMTETARLADLVLPATTFLEHDDLYQAGGHTHIQLARAVIEPPGECRSNHDLIQALAKRVGARHLGFDLSAWEIIDRTLKLSGWPGGAELAEARWHDAGPDFRTAHYLDGFAHADGKFRFKPEWKAMGPLGDRLPALPDHCPIHDAATPERPFRLITPPARGFLNSTFTETPTSQRQEDKPVALIHPEDLAALGIADGAAARLGNDRGAVTVAVKAFDGLRRGTVVVEGIWPGGAFQGGIGINRLISADAAPPNGGAVFHDTAIWIRPA
ncbi:MAG: molybdopterin oxidoreductase family protein [Alphaproteobacteria bacterium]|nr:molybdopterin oxidoreductase family protein [Alphaproteobacteria bacterium]